MGSVTYLKEKRNANAEWKIQKKKDDDLVIALAGNPNVGKSTVFNALTGMHQHTGNWPGKTVCNAQGYCRRGEQGFLFVDLPGCYSLLAHSEEEEVARDYICFGQPDAVVVVCDATCLERNLNLVLQVMEAHHNVVVCVNLMDEAKKKQIQVDLEALEVLLGIPVIGTTARSKQGLEQIFIGIKQVRNRNTERKEAIVRYAEEMEQVITGLLPEVEKAAENMVDARWACVRLIEGNTELVEALWKYLNCDRNIREAVEWKLKYLKRAWDQSGAKEYQIRDSIAASFIGRAEAIAGQAVHLEDQSYDRKDRRIDKILTSRKTGFFIMFLLLLGIFWITIIGANVPSQMLAKGLSWIGERLLEAAISLEVPESIYAPILFGVYGVLAWVVSVMLPPMAIFFPLFTLLEDFGYLPRIAFNLDRCFKCCCACGKQALTMCMGFGCNCAGITGCRIIDSPRERLMAIITNNFVPCNGRFPTMISIISMFLIGSAAGIFSSVLAAAILAAIIVLGILMTLAVSKLLSKTILKGIPSSFTLELPPYRRPQIGKVILRSVLDRTLYVLGRAILVAAPAGLVIWGMANITFGDNTLLSQCAGFLDPLGRLLGMDGVILLAFLLGLPANEIVLPIALMAYLAKGSLVEISDPGMLRHILVENGWTWVTAVSTVLFSLMHWPCGTAILTIKKETQSLKWTAVSIILPTIAGITTCFLFRMMTGIIGIK